MTAISSPPQRARLRRGRPVGRGLRPPAVRAARHHARRGLLIEAHGHHAIEPFTHLSMCVITITCSKRSLSRRNSSTTFARRARPASRRSRRARAARTPAPPARRSSARSPGAARGCDVLLAARNHRLGHAVLEHHDVVVLVQLQLVVAPVGEIGEETAGDLRELRPQLEVEVGPQVGERAIQLVVEPLVASRARRAVRNRASSRRSASPASSTRRAALRRRSRACTTRPIPARISALAPLVSARTARDSSSGTSPRRAARAARTARRGPPLRGRAACSARAPASGARLHQRGQARRSRRATSASRAPGAHHDMLRASYPVAGIASRSLASRASRSLASP